MLSEGMSLNHIEPVPDKPQTKAVEFPYPPTCDFVNITQEQVNAAISNEIQYDQLSTVEQPLTSEEQVQFGVETIIKDIVIAAGDNISVKKNIFRFMMNLDRNSYNYAITYIKQMVSGFVQELKQEILSGSFTADAENYMKFLTGININVLLKYPVNTEIYRHLVEELFRMYIELKSLSDLPPETILSLHTQIEYFASGFGLLVKLPDELKAHTNGKTAKPMSKNGENSLTTFTILPSPNEFPDVNPYKKEALDILEEIRHVVYNSLERTSSFEQYFNITAELNYADLEDDSRENIFKHTCASEKRKIDRISLKLNDLHSKLSELLENSGDRNNAHDSEMLTRYIKSVESHIKQMWEKAVFPHLLFYGNLIFGEIPSSRPQWLYLDT